MLSKCKMLGLSKCVIKHHFPIRYYSISASVELEDSSRLLQNQQYKEIQSKVNEDGYLFIRNLIPTSDILTVRKDIIKILHKYNWIDSQQDDIYYDAKCTNIKPKIEAIEDPNYWPVFDEIQCLESFHTLAHNKNLINCLNNILYPQTTFAHPRNIFRILFPKHNYWKTPPHQDWIYIQGTKNVYTSWIPLDNTPKEMGPLSILIGSHKYDILPIVKCEGAGGMGIDDIFIENELINKKGCIWGTTDFNMGDVLLFNSYNVHKAMDNNSDKLRISCDFRYQPINEEIVNGSLLPHWGRMEWDQIYSQWNNNDIKYYWKNCDLNVVQFDPSVTGNDETGAGNRPLLHQYINKTYD
eukprot:524444_1